MSLEAPEAGESVRLREAITDLRLAVATLTGTVAGLKEAGEKAVSLDKFAALEDDVRDLQRWRDWALFLIVGAVLTAVLGLVLTGTGLVRFGEPRAMREPAPAGSVLPVNPGAGSL